MPENETSRAREFVPVYECRGYTMPEWGTSIPWCWIWSRATGRVLGLRPSQLCNVSTLMAIHPDAEHWRRGFRESGRGTGIDSVKAGAWLLAECYAAGEMLPPEEARIRKPGRPRKGVA